MKNIFSGKFEEVQDKVSKEFAKNIYVDFGKVKVLSVVPLVLFFVGGGVYGIYLLGWYVTHYMDSLVVSLDAHNEYKIFFRNMWHVHLIALIFIIRLVILLVLKDRKRSFAFYYGKVLTLVFLTFWFILTFTVSEMLIASALLRTIYTIFFVLALLFTIWQSYQNAKKLVFEQSSQTSLQATIEKNKGSIMLFLGAIGGLYFMLKVQPIGDFETRITGALMDYFPLLLMIGFVSVVLYLVPTVIKAYYLHKYSERFRQKFTIGKKEWYGPYGVELKNDTGNKK